MSESQSFDMPDLDRFTAGTVGPKGQRVFYLQVMAGTATVTLKLEKQQVHALAEYLENLLSDLPTPSADAIPIEWDLVPPVTPEWVVASMGVAYQHDDNRIILWAEEAMFEEDEDEMVPPATARFRITIPQATGFVHRARQVVAAGRPPCPFCNAPLDSEGAWCACSN